MNPLLELKEFGQSIWFDNIRRSLLTSGELKRMVSEYGVTGVTSNPTIFEKAISGGGEYDEAIERLVGLGRADEEILNALVIEDIRLAAEVLLPVFNETGGDDGYVSIEVSPRLARDTAGTVKEARRLHSIVKMPNILIKVPATIEGVKAFEELIYEGININVTLLFSVERYGEVAGAYERALERRGAEGKSLKDIFSVASFFVSRVDALTDTLIEEGLKKDGLTDEAESRLKGLRAKAAVANAALAYLKYKEVFHGAAFKKLNATGARPQRLLWASTSTKNPLYSDIKYVEELIEPRTVNTMPLNTLLAFHDHGSLKKTLAESLETAAGVMDELKSAGIDYDEVTATLEERGVKAFSDSHDDLLKCIKAKKAFISMGKKSPVEFNLPGYEGAVMDAVKRMEDGRFMERLFEKDPTLWKETPAEMEQIKNALGWLALPGEMNYALDDLKALADEIKGAGFSNVVLLGMGGSSLAPLVMSRTFGQAEGYPAFTVLDSTDPDSVGHINNLVMEGGDAKKTLFIVSSKSGTTIEPLTFFLHFFNRIKKVKGESAGDNFVAITDPGSKLEEISQSHGFRWHFLNPPDVGGRFSALSYFGLVPAALMGIDVKKLLYNASRIETAEEASVPLKKRPGVMLGASLGQLALKGRDKVTFFLSEEIASFGLWIEQLLAESTGKDGKGIVPVTGEPIGSPEDYSPDRVFVYIGVGERGAEVEGNIGVGNAEAEVQEKLKALGGAGHPVIKFSLNDIYELGGEFFRWELATAAAGHIMGINPFDQPDVEAAKVLARERLEKKGGGAPGVEFEGEAFTMYMGEAAFEEVKKSPRYAKGGAEETFKAFLNLLHVGDYVGLLAYLNTFDPAIEPLLRGLQEKIMRSKKSAVEFGFGPRYLHSTGQLHKGGANNGLFIILTHGAPEEMSVAGKDFGFSRLELSQAYGDMEALDSKGRRVVLFDIREPFKESLDSLCLFIGNALL